ncbi:hypothetical protein D3Z39_15930 [Anaerotruncus colihominis]|uniref:Uncharacterized protein n=1 Tax=Anaerotruncus colihominis TaxID=169435 RepID=A0A845RNF6_9FIRM|nr:hypothetical protein [Anaerotruncus colihominis]
MLAIFCIAAYIGGDNTAEDPGAFAAGALYYFVIDVSNRNYGMAEASCVDSGCKLAEKLAAVTMYAHFGSGYLHTIRY